VAGSFRDLEAYRRARALSNEIHDAAVQWPSHELWSIGMQLIRAADSVCANIAEGSDRWHPSDRKRLLLIARGSLRETEHWLLCAEDRGLIAKGIADRVEEIARPLNGLINKAPPRP
jgi:four helix bundle protein